MLVQVEHYYVGHVHAGTWRFCSYWNLHVLSNDYTVCAYIVRSTDQTNEKMALGSKCFFHVV